MKTNIDVEIDPLFKEVVALVRQHATNACTLAIRKTGGDTTLMAMALIAELQKRLDPVGLFAPK